MEGLAFAHSFAHLITCLHDDSPRGGKEESVLESNSNVSENVFCRFWLRSELSRVDV